MNLLLLHCVTVILCLPAAIGAFSKEELVVEGDLRNWHEVRVALSSDAPVVLDAPVTIVARLLNVDPGDGPFYFTFTDDASPMHYSEVETYGLEVNFTIHYSSKSYKPGKYATTVRVYDIRIFRNEIARSSIEYRITKSLNGRLVAKQDNRTIAEEVATVAANDPTEFVAQLFDPSAFLDNVDMRFYWFVNETNYGSTNGTSFFFDFKTIGDSTVEVLALARFPENNNDDDDDVHEELRNSKTSKDASEKAKRAKGLKMGLFKLKVNPRIPMTGVKVNGQTWLKHGDLLNLNLTCNGTGPWTYCWTIKDPSYNVTGNETCESFEVLSHRCVFSIVWYLRNPGESLLVVVVDNQLDHLVKQVGIHVYDVPSRTPVSLIVIPLCSALVAVVACISGIFVFITIKRNMTGLETADFDFGQQDDQLEYKTFWERLRESMLNALGNATSKDDVSHVSSSAPSSGSSRGPPVGIHYGSIT